jgi:hypothetical protein
MRDKQGEQEKKKKKKKFDLVIFVQRKNSSGTYFVNKLIKQYIINYNSFVERKKKKKIQFSETKYLFL